MRRATSALALFVVGTHLAFAQGLSLWPEGAEMLPPTSAVLSVGEVSSERAAQGGQGLWAGDPGRYFTGALVGFLGHETGHVLANYALDTHPYLKHVEFGFIPFFTIQPGKRLTHREHYITASAGFNAQFAISEWLLTEHPDLKDEDEAFLKGLFGFNFWLGVGYTATGLAGYGPQERDTKGMADALGWSESSVAALVLAPTLLDGYRYKHPGSKWARDASRLTKLLLYGVAVEAD